MRAVLWLEALRGKRPGGRASVLVALLAAALAASVFALRLVVDDPSSAVLVLLCLPVMLLAMSFGRWAGLAAAAAAVALTGVWHLLGGDPGGPVGYLSRGVAFVLLGVLPGEFSDRLVVVQRRQREVERQAAVARAELEDAQRLGQIGSWRWAAETDRLTWSPQMYRLFDIDPAADSLSFAEALAARSHPDDAGVVVAAKESALVDHQPFEFPQRLVMPDGSVRHVVNRGEVDVDGEGTVRGMLGTTQDVTGRLEAELAAQAAIEHLSSALDQFAAAFDHAPVGMAIVDASRVVVRANPGLGALTGQRPEDLVGVSLDLLVDPRDVASVRTDFARLVSGARPGYRLELRLAPGGASPRWVSLSAAVARTSPDVQVIAHFEDIDERKSFEGRLQHLADHDALTGLFNRRRLHEELTRQAAADRRHDRRSTLVLIDLDHFKYINDTLGHQTGDRLIQGIATSLRSRLRDSDLIGRLGGDEFAVLLPEADDRRAAAVARSLLDGIAAVEVEHVGQRVRSTGSAGIATLGGPAGRDADEALANADLAMYAAKEAGRNTCVVYDPGGPHAARSRARFRWLDRIRYALDHDLFTLRAQPILDIRAGKVTGCELLLRMRDDGELIGPDVFLYIAERHGLAKAIDRVVIAQAVALVAASERPPGFRWEVNLSADSLGDPGVAGVIGSALRDSGVPPSSFVFEITETAAIGNIDQARLLAAQITQMGCCFALDDFGAGYGSFYYLKHLPFEYLKIDGEFVRGLGRSETDRVIVRAIVTAARQLGKQTVAEYVGDAATLEVLRDLGVDHAQGYYVGRPEDPALPFNLPAPRVPDDVQDARPS